MADYIARDDVITALYEEDALTRKGVKILNEFPSSNVVSRVAYDQVIWERDTALAQLAEIGKGLGEKMDDVVRVKPEVNLYNHEEIHHNCMVQVWSNTETEQSSPGWKYDQERVEKILDLVCFELCRYPSEYKDPVDLITEHCALCRLHELLEEESDV